MRAVKALVSGASVTVLTVVVASAQVSAPQIPRPDEPGHLISSNFVQDDGAVKVVKDSDSIIEQIVPGDLARHRSHEECL